MERIYPISIDEFKDLAENDISLLDTRETGEFTKGFVPGSVFIGQGLKTELWVKKLLDPRKPILLIACEDKQFQTFEKLSKSGFKIEGFLEGGFKAWDEAGEKIDLIIDIEADELAMDIPFDPNLTVIDVRRYDEFAEGHLQNAINLPLEEMVDIAQIADFEENQNIYIHSGSGYRSVIAASLLKRHGFHNLRNVAGGWMEIKKQKNIVIQKEASRLN
ncbi:MAG: rhodanese-like domain-containing protein [Ginsengibacter sp.]